jgi:MFS family permease
MGEQGGGTAVAGARYRWYTGAQAVSLVGGTMTFTALYWLTLRISHGHAAQLAVLVAAQFLPMLAFSRRAGNIVGRYRAVSVLLGTQFGQAAGSLALAVPLLAGWLPVWYLWVVSFAVGCVQCLDVPARQTFMLDLVGPAELRRGSSLYATATGLSKIAGPGLAGIIIAVSGESTVFLLDASSFTLVIAVLLVLRPKVAGPRAAAADRAAARRLRWVLDLPPGIQIASVIALLIGGFGIQFEVTNPLMATQVFHLGSLGFGLLGTCMSVGSIAGSYYSARRADPGYREFLAWSVLFGAAETVAAVMPVIWAYDVAMAAIGAATTLFAVSAVVYVQQRSPQAQRAHALSAYNAAFMGFVPAGSFLVAAVAATAGTRWALLGPGVVILVFAGLLLARPGLAQSRLARSQLARSRLARSQPAQSRLGQSPSDDLAPERAAGGEAGLGEPLVPQQQAEHRQRQPD